MFSYIYIRGDLYCLVRENIQSFSDKIRSHLASSVMCHKKNKEIRFTKLRFQTLMLKHSSKIQNEIFQKIRIVQVNSQSSMSVSRYLHFGFFSRITGPPPIRHCTMYFLWKQKFKFAHIKGHASSNGWGVIWKIGWGVQRITCLEMTKKIM